MNRIVEAVEADPPNVAPLNHVPRTKPGVLSYAARDIGERLQAKTLVAATQSGDTASRLARLHPRLPLLAFTSEPAVRNQLALTWGTETSWYPGSRPPTRWSDRSTKRCCPSGDTSQVTSW